MTPTIELAEDPVEMNETESMNDRLLRLITPPVAVLRIPFTWMYRYSSWMLDRLNRITGDEWWYDDEPLNDELITYRDDEIVVVPVQSADELALSDHQL